MTLKLIYENEIVAGDVLLCYSEVLNGKNDRIQNGYSHVAIVTSDKKVVESSSSGIKVTCIPNLLDEYEHIAVLRNHELWSPERLKKLDSFVTKKLGAGFNCAGMYRLPERKERQEQEAMNHVNGYFEGTYKPTDHNKGVYFCSELITASFIEVGIIDESASILLSPETLSPEDIGRDKAFGFFAGYIKSNDDYKIPEEDYFRTSI